MGAVKVTVTTRKPTYKELVARCEALGVAVPSKKFFDRSIKKATKIQTRKE